MSFSRFVKRLWPSGTPAKKVPGNALDRVNTLKALAELDSSRGDESVPERPSPLHPELDLNLFEKRVFSQNGEDGILEEIFNRIGTHTKYFVEFGVETGEECNCADLAINKGWRGLFIEASDKKFAKLESRYKKFPVKCLKAFVTSKTIQDLFRQADVPAELDLLSIDIDGNDYWVWAAITDYHPRVVVMEYNSSIIPPKLWVMKENDSHSWNGTNYFGASLASLTRLGRKKGYTLVCTDATGNNAFFVRNDLFDPDKFVDPAAQYFFHRHVYGPEGGGHPQGSGPFEEI